MQYAHMFKLLQTVLLPVCSYLIHIQLMALIRQCGPIFSHQRSERKTKQFFLPFVLS